MLKKFLFILAISFLLLSGVYLSMQPNKNAAAKSLFPKIKQGDPLPANLFVELAKIVNPAVVNISTSQLPRKKQMPRFYGDPFFDLFGPFMFPQQSRPRQSLGTGFIIRKDGLIITNNHVVDHADIIKVQINENSKKIYEAEIVGKDASTDIALIKIKSKKKLPTVKLGSSKDLQVGEWVAAFGNPFGHGHSITKGIISAIGREIDQLNRFPFIQTDASINPGNSGGPLVNTRGEVIGVNTAIDARAQGIGFAIPIDNVKSIIETLEKEGRIKRGYLGVVIADINDPRIAESLNLKTTEGALVEHVYGDSPADKAGILPYDFIIKFGQRNISRSKDLIKAIATKSVGSKASVELIRNSKKKTIKVTIEEHPEEKAKRPKHRVKKYRGQKAPFNLGFKIANYSTRLQREFALPKLSKKRPVVIEVELNTPSSGAGLVPGDIVLDVNKIPVYTAQNVLKQLNKKFNVLRILRGNRAMLVYLRSY